jgi:hypothetical protein
MISASRRKVGTVREKRGALLIVSDHLQRRFAPCDLEAIRELIRRARDCKGNAVRGWDDPADFGMWKSLAYSRLKPAFFFLAALCQ